MTRRDMTKKEFMAALERRGFRKVCLWFHSTQDGDDENVGYGAVIGGNGLDRRATLAKIIKARDRHEAERSAA